MKILKAIEPVREVAATGMRDIRQLLKTEATCDRLADFTFRSSEEVAFYLAGLDTGSHPVTAQVSPVALTEAYKSLCSLQNKLDVLDSMNVTIAYEFRKESARLLPLLARTKLSLESKRDLALAAMQKAARKQAPASLTQAATEAQAHLAQKLGKSYASVKDYVFVTASHGGLCFNHYIQYAKLQNKVQGYTYPEYFVVVSAVVRDKQVQLHANTLHKFCAPGAFNLGPAVDAPRKLNTVLSQLLVADEFLKTRG